MPVSLGGRWRKPGEWEPVGQQSQVCPVHGVVIPGVLNPGPANCFASVEPISYSAWLREQALTF